MFKKILKSYDYSLIITISLLCLFGLVMVYSASMASAVQRYGVASDYFYQKQKVFLIVAAIVFLITAATPYKLMQNRKVLAPMVFLSLVCLVFLIGFGHAALGGQRWIDLGPISIQPSEFIKLSVIIYMSAVYAKKQPYINHFNKGVAPPLAYLVIICLLVAIQPDFGTAIIIALIAVTLIISSGMNLKNLTKLVIIAMIVMIPFTLVFKDKIFSGYRSSRIAVVSNPFKTFQGTGFQLSNSLIAIGTGGINGVGLGRGIEKLGYLPESHTDFIMAVIAEELGIWGVGFVIISLAYIVLRGLYVALQCKDPFGSLLAIGISGMIGIQSFINLGGVSGFIPLSGVPLPFVSYGGSSLIQLAIAMGILVNVSMFVNYEKKYKNKHEQKLTKNNQSKNVFQIRS